ncbi:MAG TPA: DNA-directed RNA polymerase subunit omega [Clostridiaceae bacterium]|jgi:DNA-directed RNA polymerase subunit omega|nr:DNA-directed RNA polymerase subunit omega [Clostridiaceae bacterium]
MIYPPMPSLLEKVDSRYTLAILIAKRARMLTNGAQKLTEFNSDKDVTIAIHEINEGKIAYHRVRKPQPTHDNMVETSLNSIEDQI